MENKEELQQIIQRIEGLEEEKKAIQDDIREVYSEAKGKGYDVKVIRQVIKLSKMTMADRQEFEYELEKYKEILEMNNEV